MENWCNNWSTIPSPFLFLSVLQKTLPLSLQLNRRGDSNQGTYSIDLTAQHSRKHLNTAHIKLIASGRSIVHTIRSGKEMYGWW